ncbi:MAG TPA: hypothetical protein VKA18_10415 [Alphaproteobacteria bacterium]|nr:hypothetical protein [Alphaproteobacteria bacterium]
MKKLFATIAVSAVISTGPVFAAGFGQWDKDSDGHISMSEFRAGFQDQGWFDTWDTDNSRTLNPPEFYRGMFDAWDQDGDGTLSVQEWDDGVDAIWEEDPVNFALGSWDTDGNGKLSKTEFMKSMAEARFFDVLAGRDADLTEREFARSLFNWFDDDSDGNLNQAQFDHMSMFVS